jgi:hypothetical protein
VDARENLPSLEVQVDEICQQIDLVQTTVF